MSDAGQGISSCGLLTLAGVSTVLLVGRLLIRSIILKSFKLDDLSGVSSWVFMTIAVIIATVELPLSYKYTSILIGESPAPPESELTNIAIKLRKLDVASQTFFWTSLFCVKSSFMFLYKIVFGRHDKYNRVWLWAMVYIVLCYGICLVGVYGQCGEANHLSSYVPGAIYFTTSFEANWVDYFFNVTSDILVVALPIPVIWRLNMGKKQKLALSAICGLAFITVAFENNHLTNLYSYLELLVSVLISQLPSYRFLVSPSDKDREYRRLFWSRITMRSYHSSSSGYSMQDFNQTPREREHSETIHKTTGDQAEVSTYSMDTK
ncbi:hypothetical protein K445DRAFT_12427 [Daldinia sp. EC12]|nr:hypothetical protein K445DRAFT_12427 [Daldinia sp. EC12]